MWIACVQFFPDPGYAQEKAGRHLAQIRLYGAQAFAERNPAAQIERCEIGHRLFGDMAERQIAEAGGVAVQMQPRHQPGHDMGDVAIGDHRPFGLSGRARGVDHQRGVIQRLGIEQRIGAAGIGGMASGAQPFHLAEGDQVGVVVAAQATHVDDHDPAQPRQFRPPLQHLVRLFLILHHHHVDIGMGEHIGDLARRAGRVDADRDRTDDAGAQLGDHPFGPVFGQNADMAPGAHAQRLQPQPEGAGALEIAGPGDRLPDAVILLADREPVALSAGMLAQHLGHGQGRNRHGHDSHRLRRL